MKIKSSGNNRFSTNKSIHITIDNETYVQLRQFLFEKNLSLQETLQFLIDKICSKHNHALALLNSLIKSKEFQEAKEFSRKNKKKNNANKVLDAFNTDSLYYLIEEENNKEDNT